MLRIRKFHLHNRLTSVLEVVKSALSSLGLNKGWHLDADASVGHGHSHVCMELHAITCYHHFTCEFKSLQDAMNIQTWQKLTDLYYG